MVQLLEQKGLPMLFGSFVRRLGDRGWTQLVRLTDGRTTVALDCGLPYAELCTKLSQFGRARSPDYLALTHFHADHFHRQTVRDLVVHGQTKLCVPDGFSAEPKARQLRTTLRRTGRKHLPLTISVEDELRFRGDKLSFRALPGRHNGASGVSNALALEHQDLQLLYVTDVSDLPSNIYRLEPDVCVMEMNHPPALKPGKVRNQNLSAVLASGQCNHLSNEDVAKYLLRRPILNLRVSKEDKLKLFVAMHLGPGNTKLEVLCAIVNSVYSLRRRPVIAIRGNDRVYVAWIDSGNSSFHPKVSIWSFSEALFGIYKDEIRVWHEGPINGMKSAADYILSFRFNEEVVVDIHRPPDAIYLLDIGTTCRIRLQQTMWDGVSSELYQEIDVIRRKARRVQALSSLSG